MIDPVPLLSGPQHTGLVGIAQDGSVVRVQITPPVTDCAMERRAEVLPRAQIDGIVLPVDPVVWDAPSAPGDVLLSVARDGLLQFWAPSHPAEEGKWRCTGSVATGRTGVRLARCSSARKTVLSKMASTGFITQ